MKLGALAWQVDRGQSLEAWADRLDQAVAEAVEEEDVDLVFTAEYAPMEAALGEEPDLAGELARACASAPEALQIARAIAEWHGVWLLPGSFPWREGGIIRNRAPLIAPDGRVAWQDKHVMTRFEAEHWGISPGAPPAVFDTDFGRIGIAICFDLEFPQLVRAQVEAGAWLILAPCCTDTPRGFNRVRIAAAARAMENQCFVAIAPTVGAAPWSASLDKNHGQAAIFGPVDHGFPVDGVLAAGAMDAPGLVYAKLDPARLDAVRRNGAVRNHLAWPPTPPPCRVERPA